MLFRKWIQKSCLLCRNFISIFRINRTLHSCLGILLAREDKIRISKQPCNNLSYISSLKYLSHACNLQIICPTHYMLKLGMMCIYSIFKTNPSSYIMLSTKNAVKFFKPFCCLLLLSGSSHPLVSTTEIELDELLKQLQKWRKEGEYIMRVKRENNRSWIVLKYFQFLVLPVPSLQYRSRIR